jgi:hypothetical protein
MKKHMKNLKDQSPRKTPPGRLYFFKTKRKVQAIIIDDNFICNYSRTEKNGSIHWECKHRREGCKYRAHTQGISILNEQGSHSLHLPDVEDIEAIKALDYICQRIKPSLTTRIGGKRLFDEFIAQENFKSKVDLKYSNISSTVSRRTKSLSKIIIKKLSDIDPSEQIFKLSDEADSEEIIKEVRSDFIICTHSELITLSTNITDLHLFIDGTFYVSSEIFKQLILLRALDKSKNLYFTLAYCFVNNKQGKLYKSLFKSFQQICNETSDSSLKPTKITSDYEIAFINASKKHFPDATLKLCYFHYCQAIRHNADIKGLKEILTPKSDALKFYYHYKYLPYMFDDHIPLLFNFLSKNKMFKSDFKNFNTYFKNTWIDKYKITDYCHFSDLSFKTNNPCESQNHVLNNNFNTKPGFLEVMKIVKQQMKLDIRKIRLRSCGRKSLFDPMEAKIMSDYELELSTMSDLKSDKSLDVSKKYLTLFAENYFEGKIFNKKI